MKACTKCHNEIVSIAATCAAPDCKVSLRPKCAPSECELQATFCCSRECKEKLEALFKCFVCKLPVSYFRRESNISGKEDSYWCIECNRHFHEVRTALDGMHCTSCAISRVQSVNLKIEIATLAEKSSKLKSDEEPKDDLIKLTERFYGVDDFCHSDSKRDDDEESESDDNLQEFLLQISFTKASPEMANAYTYREQNYKLPTFSGSVRERPAFSNHLKTSTQKGNFSDDKNADRPRNAHTDDAMKFAGVSLQFTTSGAEVMRNLKKPIDRAKVTPFQLTEQCQALIQPMQRRCMH